MANSPLDNPRHVAWRHDVTHRLPLWAKAIPGAAGERAWAEFRRTIVWIALIGVLMVGLAIGYLALFGSLTFHMVVATTLGVFFSVLIGSGLFAAAFFSDKSGYDRLVDDATRSARTHAPVGLPPGLVSYRRTATFTEDSVPAALRADHDTKPGTWGLIHVEAGRLRYRITDPRRDFTEILLSPDDPPGVVEPTILHNVEPEGPVRFHVEFWRAP